MTSDDGDEEIDHYNSDLSSEVSSYSIGELHTAVVLASVNEEEEGGEDDLWEQLSSVSSSNITAVPYGDDPVLTKQELIRQIHLRRHVDQLKRNLGDKEESVEELR